MRSSYKRVKVQIVVRMPDEQWEAYTAYKIKTGLNNNDVIKRAVERFIKEIDNISFDMYKSLGYWGRCNKLCPSTVKTVGPVVEKRWKFEIKHFIEDLNENRLFYITDFSDFIRRCINYTLYKEGMYDLESKGFCTPEEIEDKIEDEDEDIKVELQYNNTDYYEELFEDYDI